MEGRDAPLRVEVLGPLRLLDSSGRDVTPTGDLQRRLTALLVLRRGRTVSVDSAVDALWRGPGPRDPVAAVQNHMFRLRRGLPSGVVASVGEGYRLDPAAVDVDVDRLTSLLAADPGADPAALTGLDAMLERWRGPAYPELEDVDEARAEATRLEELRCRAREVRAQARLALGRTDSLVAELLALAGEQPLRERPRALLIEALAATGRQAEALGVYDDFRRLLGDELGIEPSPALAARHARLLAGADAPATSPGRMPAAATTAPSSRLPAPPTSLVGRDALVSELAALVDTVRLVTLVGPGGVGKTRLLLEVGLRLLAERPQRPVILAELASADTGSAVDTVAAALRVDARPGFRLADRIADVLGDSEVVVLLDNCEHVLDPVSELVELLLARCPRVRLGATSRERLRVAGEQLRTVPPLPYQGADAPAVRLFVDRARAVAPDFDPDAQELAVIAGIAHRLDGLPLAIELAAARMLTHDLAEVADGLDHRFFLLSSGVRTSTRHRSLHAAVSWSFDLLDEPLQRTFAEVRVHDALPSGGRRGGVWHGGLRGRSRVGAAHREVAGRARAPAPVHAAGDASCVRRRAARTAGPPRRRRRAARATSGGLGRGSEPADAPAGPARPRRDR